MLENGAQSSLAHLITMRSALSFSFRSFDYRGFSHPDTMPVQNFLHLLLVQHLLNTSPYHQAGESVQLMTVFKSKGLEFSHVFLLAVDDSTWGSSGKSSSKA